MTGPGIGTEVEGLLRSLAPRVLGAVVRRYGHFDTAEDAVQEALVAAATRWPDDGVPDNPRAWLITVAARRLTDLLRAEQARRRREDAVARWALPDEWTAPPADRLSAVLHVLYLIFNEGYASTGGPGLYRVELSAEAIRLTRIVHRLLPDDGEVAGLLALMLLTDARRPARPPPPPPPPPPPAPGGGGGGAGPGGRGGGGGGARRPPGGGGRRRPPPP